DYTRSESYRLARAAGTNLVSKLQSALASGAGFEATAQEAGFEVIDLEPFARDARFIAGLPPQADAATIARAAFETAPGPISDFVSSLEGGLVVFVEEAIPVSDEEVQIALPTYLAELRRSSATRAFDDWFRNEMQQAQLTLADDESAQGDPQRSSF